MPNPNEHVTGTAVLRSGTRIEVDEYLYVPPGTSLKDVIELLRRRATFQALEVASFYIARRRL